MVCLREHSVLAVGFRPSFPGFQGSASLAMSGVTRFRDALELLRCTDVDLLLVAHRSTEGAPWLFVQTVRSRRPGQRWVLVTDNLNDADEIRARSLGVMKIIESPAAVPAMLRELCESASRRVASEPVASGFRTPAGALLAR